VEAEEKYKHIKKKQKQKTKTTGVQHIKTKLPSEKTERPVLTR
jgi:hypothetical protein